MESTVFVFCAALVFVGGTIGTTRAGVAAPWCDRCPDEWTRFNNSCYLFSDMDDGISYDDALNYCTTQQQNSHLVTVETEAEQLFLRSFLGKLNTDDIDYWLGGTDAAVEGTWVWSNSGLQFSYTDWCPGQPNDYHHHEDCLTFAERCDFRWQDAYCTYKHRPICELDLGYWLQNPTVNLLSE